MSDMIRAVAENGLIRPLEPMPPEWRDGRRLTVEVDVAAEPDDLDSWYRTLQELGAAEYGPGEREVFDETLREADEQAKAMVRREMGLD